MPYLEHALEVFGPGRCMFASDWPVASLQTTHEAWADVVLELISPLSPADRLSVLGGTAITTYQLAGF
jgi:L-fuconolactonase